MVSGLNHRVDVNTLETRPATALELNEIGEATLRLDRITPSIRMARTLTPAASS
jgi:sulfate adenylyltransferase subunit 1 (EFTu-like GTPase family)